MNDVLWRSVKRAQITATKELANLIDSAMWETPGRQRIDLMAQGQANGL